MRAKLRIQPPEGEPFEVDIANTATIGRSRDNTVSLHFSPHVSRQHAIIRCHNAYEYQIMDLGSRNGTFVDGRRVITPLTLRNGSIIRITSNELLFEQIDDAPHDGGYDVTLAGTDAGIEEVCDVAIMVCDIRAFSTMSEQLPEEILARTLGEWFRTAGNLVQQSGGTIDKFIGDAILAYWNPADGEGGEVRAALGVGRELLTLAEAMRWPLREAPPFRIAVALHHGTVTCGNIGLVAQRDATIIGDAVNTAFRIESIMKPLNKPLVLSEDFLARLAESAEAYADLGVHELKGKKEQVRLFGLTGD
ncbi:MAG: adenylate/guanylate cyclase domain-containing protein [Terrimicrobiaceae bacterium]|nr:adenylate/guanylate cyclase domain-containing protein [Terrimicrobiaceae bacterium]